MKELTMRRKLLLAAGGLIVLLIAVYIGFSIYFMGHFYFHTTINGMNVSGYSVEQVKKETENRVSAYELKIVERGGDTEQLKGAEFALKPEWDNSLNELVDEQNGFMWIAHLFKEEDLTNQTLVSYDSAQLKSAIDALSCMDTEKQIQPVDATVSDYNAEDGYTLVPAVQGTVVEESSMLNGVEDAISGLAESFSMEDADCYKKPAVEDDDEGLLGAIDTLNQYADSVITYQIGDDTRVLDISTFHDWISLSEDMEPVIDDAQVEDYVKSLANIYNTCYGARTLATSYGTQVTISNSHYGWKVDTDAEKAAIIEEIQAGEEVNRDLHYSMTANSHSGNDYGNSYVEINLTSQHLFLYINGSLVVESDFVSGNVDGSHETPPGVFGVTYTERNAILRGPGYATPVSFWMPFNGDIGMHDATWRGDFGGSIYKRDGSHGCINLPYSAAQTIFANVSAGFPVLVYELPGTETSKGIAQDQAYAVSKEIRQIGDVTLESEGAITSARAHYDALSDTAKAYVTNYAVLEYAEETLARLKEEQAQ